MERFILSPSFENILIENIDAVYKIILIPTKDTNDISISSAILSSIRKRYYSLARQTLSETRVSYGDLRFAIKFSKMKVNNKGLDR